LTLIPRAVSHEVHDSAEDRAGPRRLALDPKHSAVLKELQVAWHRIDRYANSRVEGDHG
jgi:hypothetical protein